jgi:hypothetical protein
LRLWYGSKERAWWLHFGLQTVECPARCAVAPKNETRSAGRVIIVLYVPGLKFGGF